MLCPTYGACSPGDGANAYLSNLRAARSCPEHDAAVRAFSIPDAWFDLGWGQFIRPMCGIVVRWTRDT